MHGRTTLGIALLAFTATACYPDRSVDSTSEFASVTTLFDTEAEFTTERTTCARKPRRCGSA